MRNVSEHKCKYEEATSEILSIMFGFGISVHSAAKTIELIGDQIFPLYSKQAETLAENLCEVDQPTEAKADG